MSLCEEHEKIGCRCGVSRLPKQRHDLPAMVR